MIPSSLWAHCCHAGASGALFSRGGTLLCGGFAGDPFFLWSGIICSLTLSKDQFHKMVELTMAAREAYKTMLETTRQEPAQGPSGSAEGGPPASPTTEEPHYSECWGGFESGPSVL